MLERFYVNRSLELIKGLLGMSRECQPVVKEGNYSMLERFYVNRSLELIKGLLGT